MKRKRLEPIQAWSINPCSPRKRWHVVIGTRADAEAKAREMGGHLIGGPFTFTIAIKP
jgi:hypothetical protein